MEVTTPLILVNFKSYFETVGERALQIAQMAEKVNLETKVCVVVAPQFVDIPSLSHAVSIPVFSQHIDPIATGAFTGHVLPEAIRKAGAVGTLINHSERRLNLADIDAGIRRAKETDLFSVVCANNAKVSTAIAALNPNMIAVEPPELIGTGIPVSKAKPAVVQGTVDLVRRVNPHLPILCGAGITKSQDVTAAVKLGTEGILVASGVVKAPKPYRVLLEFAEALIR